MCELIRRAVRSGHNLIVSGGTGAGKTTLLNALAGLVAEDERIITVEDAAELDLHHHHVVRFEARPESAEGGDEITVRHLVRNALRMRPDRLIVGEVRGPEALDLVQALNTGHAGCLSTVHANGTLDALRRIEMLALSASDRPPHRAVREQLAAAVDLVVQLGRVSGRRRIVEVAEVAGRDRVRTLATGDDRVAEITRPPRRQR